MRCIFNAGRLFGRENSINMMLVMDYVIYKSWMVTCSLLSSAEITQLIFPTKSLQLMLCVHAAFLPQALRAFLPPPISSASHFWTTYDPLPTSFSTGPCYTIAPPSICQYPTSLLEEKYSFVIAPPFRRCFCSICVATALPLGRKRALGH